MDQIIEEIIDSLVFRAVFTDSDTEAECLVLMIKAIRAWQGDLA